jgi:hypothetical protein
MKKTLAIGLAIGLALDLATLPYAVAQQPATGLVGTWILAGADRETGGDETTRVRGRGLLIVDRAGNVFEFFDTGPTSRPSVQDDPQQAFADYGGFWGRYTVDETAGRIDFEAEVGVSPSVDGLLFSRSYELDGDRLVLTSGEEPQAQGHMRWTWERMPLVENLSPAYREVVGFWRHIEERRVDTATGEVQSTSRRSPSVIVYTPSGFVGVHFPPLGREPFAGANPTEDEARAALRGYIGYYGALGVYPGEVSHDILSGVTMTPGSILRRYAAIEGDELIVTLQGFARAGTDRPQTVTEVVLHRLSDADDMLPAAGN